MLDINDFRELDRLTNKSPEAFEKVIQILDSEYEEPLIILDIGSRSGIHSRLFNKYGFTTETIDMDASQRCTYTGDYTTYKFPKQFDAIWCNHVLEHQLNVNMFLQKIRQDVVPNGLIAINVPRAFYRKPENKVVSGHVTMWNAGLLLYNMILAGIDCGNAKVKTAGYNVCVIARNNPAKLPKDLTMNRGDIERLEPYFPFKAAQGFDGDIEELNW